MEISLLPYPITDITTIPGQRTSHIYLQPCGFSDAATITGMQLHHACGGLESYFEFPVPVPPSVLGGYNPAPGYPRFNERMIGRFRRIIIYL
jgi:hypothetical protein